MYKSIFKTVICMADKIGMITMKSQTKNTKENSKLTFFNFLSAVTVWGSRSEHKTFSEVGHISVACLPTIFKQPTSVTITLNSL